ncbi:SUKH-3 immunity protein [Anaerocolumna jejuensis DSM 15929]|uniref:SUKH-3 immunity protein n=1 Tax=Anaerocolumna jejuensis DSM 15929 TaxID=1121322 RepID=A0A1M6XC05_9FIRM|nr:SUKH-3 domain-containing protein [Anaerocolumna jejuensis]SHL03419.1 SUKH-3 immunity protein [Anaerocolumna jejuensis DSM 15929]
MDTVDIYFGYSGKKGYNSSKPDYMYGAGADIDGIFLNTKTVKMGEYAPPCDNCKITFNGFLMPYGERYMNDITLKRLEESGWFLERKINIEEIKELYEQRGFKLIDIVQRFLENYGMLEFRFPKKGSPFNTIEMVSFNPFSALGNNIRKDFFNGLLEEFPEAAEIKENEFYPIGEIARGNMILLMTKEGKFFSYTDGCLVKNGENISEMLDCVVGEICRPYIYD